jgi:GAF domain-containing protein
MSENKSHLGQVRRRFHAPQHGSDTLQTLLIGEDSVLELISTGAPLLAVLDKLCSAIDAQVGDVASLVFLPDDDEHYMHTVAQSALHLGLSIFCFTGIFSRSGDLLGTLEMYCCFPRIPTPTEIRLIERATHLAALAIQRHHRKEDFGSFFQYWKGAVE